MERGGSKPSTPSFRRWVIPLEVLLEVLQEPSEADAPDPGGVDR